VLGAVAATLGWLMFALAGDHRGWVALPDANGSTVETLADHGRRLTINDVIGRAEAEWRSWSGKGYIWAGPGDAVWVRVTLRNPTAAPSHGVLADTEYFSDRVDFWALTEGGEPQAAALQSGEKVSSWEKPLWGRNAAFAVDVPADGKRIFYLRAEDFYAVWMRMAWCPEQGAFHAAQVRDVLAEGVYYGMLMALLFYNAVLWVRLRFADTGYYVGYLGTMAAFIFMTNGGLSLLGLRVGSPWAETMATGALALSGIFLVQFGRVFLELKTRTPKVDRAARLWCACLGLLAIGTLFMPWMAGTTWLYVTVPTIMVTHGVMLVMAGIAWRAGAQHARYFILAFGFLFLGALPAVVTWVELDTQKEAVMGLLVGSALEMLVLSLAVADRLARIQREHVEAKEKLVEETEQRRAIQEAYADELEVEVRERTRELVEASADKDRMISVIGHDLRSPLTALTRTAEYLSAGETGQTPQARFIGDTAQLGRQVLLLIEDLVLWARLRAGTTHLVAHPVAGLIEPVMELYRPLAKSRGVELSRADVSDDMRVTTDLVLAQTLVRNLVANALRFARSRVHVTATATGAGVRLTVRDDGPGLPAAVAARLVPDATAPDWAGNGLGLRLCAEISRTLGAGLRAESLPEGGTEFSFTLTATPAEEGSHS